MTTSESSSQLDDEMGLFDTMYHCRAMRKLDTKPVPQELLVKLVDAANQAPSGSNMQSGRWMIVQDPTVKQALAELNRAGVTDYIGPMIENPGSLPHQDQEKRTRMMKSVLWQMEHLHEIPALIIACMDFGVKVDAAMMAQGGGSIWPGIQNLLLAARALGLGAAPTTLALRDQAAVAKVLNLPETMGAFCLIPVGYPLGKFGPVTRKPLSEVLRFDQWEGASPGS